MGGVPYHVRPCLVLSKVGPSQCEIQGPIRGLGALMHDAHMACSAMPMSVPLALEHHSWLHTINLEPCCWGEAEVL